jgi:hypothetical protein
LGKLTSRPVRVAIETNAHGGGTLPPLADGMELFRTLFNDPAPDQPTAQE